MTTLATGERRLYPDTSKWGFTFWPGIRWPESYGAGTNWLEGNAESQAYLSAATAAGPQQAVPSQHRYDPFTISPDGLKITAAPLSREQQQHYKIGGHRRFGSGMLLSKASFRFGSIRMTAKMPAARGSWPALWLLPKSNAWPPEIDVVEIMAWGKRAQQAHVGVLAAPSDGTGKSVGWIDLPSRPSEGFHEYGLDWSEKTIRILFDGAVISEHPTPPSLKTEDMYVIINFAVGGKWPYNELGVAPIDSIDDQRLQRGAEQIEPDYPADMVIRSIRVTQP